MRALSRGGAENTEKNGRPVPPPMLSSPDLFRGPIRTDGAEIPIDHCAFAQYPFAGIARERLEYDLYYIENMSLKLDLKIMFQTVWFVLAGKSTR